MIRRQVAVGGAWMLAQSLSHRVLAILGQFLLAWLIAPEQFGLIGIASGLSLLVDVLNQVGIADVLVNRYPRFRIWGPVGHSMVLVVGFLTSLVMVVLGVVASRIYGSDDLAWILAIYALAAPIQAWGFVSATKLRAEMQFSSIAKIHVTSTLTATITSVVLAFCGLGAYSIAWARPLEALVKSTCMVRKARVGFLHRFTLRGWRYLIADCFHSYLTTLFNIAIHQCDYLILGLFVSKTAVGVYFMAFTLSSQALSLIVLNLVGVLYPALARLSENRLRLTRAMIDSSKVVAFASVPVCALQLINARPFVPVALDAKWLGIIPLVQIMSLGSAFRCIGWQWRSQLKVQSKFSTLATISGISVAACLLAVVWGSSQGGVIGCTVAISIYYMIASPLQLFLTTRKTGGTVLEIADLFLRPICIAGFSFACGWLAATPFRDRGAWLQEILLQSILGLIVYLFLSWQLNRQPCENIWNMLGFLRKSESKVT